ncbi:MAG: hypothetical protein ABGX00_09130 [Allomuricauda sp.]
MKNYKTKALLTIALLALLTVHLYSCESKVKFKQINPPEKFGVLQNANVVSYSLRYNPRAYATITISLVNGAKYEATDLTPSQITALLSILNLDSVQFDTENDEFFIKD